MTAKEAEKRLFDEIDRILEENGKPKPMPGVLPYYERNDSRIPERIRISFDDGTTAVYELKSVEVHSLVKKSIMIIRKWNQGDDSQPRRRRRCRK